MPATPDPLQQVLDETRRRFIATFPAQCDALRVLIARMAEDGPEGSAAALTATAHRLSGLAGTIGFPAISASAAELEDLLEAPGFDAARAGDIVDTMKAACAAGPAKAGVPPPPTSLIAMGRGEKILFAEDEPGQQAVVSACLTDAGYLPVAVVSGDLVVSTARVEKPALILLDVALPNLDGYSACRLLKADPELAAIPVIFMTAGANLEDRLAGLALGAEDFLHKPVDMRELVLRIQLLLRRTSQSTAPTIAAAPEPMTVVVAEDDPDVTRIVDVQLRAAGYTSVLAGDGEEALEAVRAHSAQLLVLDLMMPKINGFDVLTQLRKASPLWPRIIVLSGRGREQDVSRAFELGADDYVTKPFNPQELMARIARLVRQAPLLADRTG